MLSGGHAPESISHIVSLALPGVPSTTSQGQFEVGSDSSKSAVTRCTLMMIIPPA
jgi:hypothetical protein